MLQRRRIGARASRLGDARRFARRSIFLIACLNLFGCGGGGSSSIAPEVPRAWGTASLIEATDDGSSSPGVVMDDNDRAIAWWTQTIIPGGTRLVGNYFDGAGWGLVDVIGGLMLHASSVAIGGSGDAIAVWSDTSGGWARQFDGKWGASDPIDTSASQPRIAMDQSGTAIVVYRRSGDIWASRFSAGAWDTPQRIEAGTGLASNPRIAMDGSGNAVAVWHQHDGMRDNIWANRFFSDDWGTAQVIELDDGAARAPEIAIDSHGDAVVVWRQHDGTRENIWANRFSGGAWGAAELIESDNSGTAFYPHVVMNRDGEAIAVWYQHDGTRYNIWANRFLGGSWGAPQVIDNEDGDAVEARIGADGNGNAIAVWYQTDPSRNNIWAAHFNDNAWGPAQPIETSDANATAPAIAMSRSGRATVVWQEFDGMHTNIWANRFE